MNDFLNLLLPWIGNRNNLISDIFVSIILAIFFVLFFIFAIRIFRRTKLIKNLASQVAQHSKPVKPETLSELKSTFNSNSEFVEAWQEFEDSLITRERDGHQGIVYKTDEASLFFSEQRLLEQHLNLRSWNSVPALLVGMGILGTFVGLVWGLIPFSKITFSETDSIQDAIKVLLTGLSTAFVTSVWGMLLSLLFNAAEKIGISKVHKAIAKLQRSLDRLFTLTVTQEIEFRQADELAQQTQALKSFSTDLANEITSAMKQGRQEIIQEFRSAPKMFSNAISEELTPLLNDLKGAVGILQQHKQEAAEIAIERMITEFQKTLSGAVKTQMEALAETINRATDRLSALPEHLTTMMWEVEEQMEKLREKEASAFQKAIDTHQKGLSDTTYSVRREMEQTITSIRELLKSTADKTDAQIGKRIADIEETSQLTIQALRTSITEIQNSVTTIASETTVKSEEMITRMHGLVDQSANRFEKIFASGESSISTLLEQQEKQIEEANAHITNSRETLEKSSKVLEKMDESIGGIQNLFEKTQTLSNALLTNGERIEEASKQLMNTSQAFTEENTKSLASNREATEQLQRLLGESQKSLSDFTKRFQTIETGLNSVFGEIEDGLARYSTTTRESINTYLTQFSEHLTAAAEALAGSIEALEESVEELNDMNEQLANNRKRR